MLGDRPCLSVFKRAIGVSRRLDQLHVTARLFEHLPCALYHHLSYLLARLSSQAQEFRAVGYSS